MSFAYIITGVALVVLTGIAFSRKSKASIRFWATASSLSSCVHYGVAGLWTPTGISILGTCSTWILGGRDTKRNVPISFLFLFLAINAAIVVWTWIGWTSLLPATAGMAGLGAIYLKTPRAALTAKLCIEPLWLYYNVQHSAWFAMFASIALISGTSLRLIALHREQKGLQAVSLSDGDVGDAAVSLPE